jgi:hypothetical protein
METMLPETKAANYAQREEEFPRRLRSRLRRVAQLQKPWLEKRH